MGVARAQLLQVLAERVHAVDYAESRTAGRQPLSAW